MPSGSFSVMGVSQAGTGRMAEMEVLRNGGVSKASRRSQAQISGMSGGWQTRLESLKKVCPNTWQPTSGKSPLAFRGFL